MIFTGRAKWVTELECAAGVLLWNERHGKAKCDKGTTIVYLTTLSGLSTISNEVVDSTEHEMSSRMRLFPH